MALRPTATPAICVTGTYTTSLTVLRSDTTSSGAPARATSPARASLPVTTPPMGVVTV